MKTLTNFLNRSSIKKQIVTTITLGVLVALITTTINSIWVANKKFKSVFINQGIKISENLALNSDLALLYGSKENAASIVSTTLSFPGVEQLIIFTKNMTTLIKSGNENRLYNYHLKSLPFISSSSLIYEDDKYFHFSSPVVSDSNDMDDFLYPNKKEKSILGYVYIIINKKHISEINNEIYTYNFIITILMAAFLVFTLRAIINHITHPLEIISTAINHAHNFRKITPYGPPEIRLIANTYNNMIETIAEKDLELRQNNERLGIEVDIRTFELKEARDRAITANKHKSEFVANITHELRTPLQSIIGYCDLTIEELDEINHAYIIDDQKRILENARKLLFLINNLLDLSKLESGKMRVNLNNCEIDIISDALENMIRPLISKRNNTLSIQRNYDKTNIVIDSDKTHQIILNLLSNANKFTQNGTINLEISLDEINLIFCIKDTGIGISSDQIKTIFEPFHQLDSSLTREFSGTGLGLTITKKLCGIMGGSISVESEIGKGSCFTVYLPYESGT